MKKTTKQEIVSRMLVCSSLLVLSIPMVTQTISAIPASAEIVNHSNRQEESMTTGEIMTSETEVAEQKATPLAEDNEINARKTAVNVHYLNLDGRELASSITMEGLPTNKVNDSGAFSYDSASIAPEELAGYTLVEDYNNQLPLIQKMQLKWTLSDMGLDSGTVDSWEDKVILATESHDVPYPGYADKRYYSDGTIVPSYVEGAPGVQGYGQTDVYYFYAGNQQKVVYNVIDDIDGKTLEENVTFDSGATNENLTMNQADLQKIADNYLSKGYEIVSVDSVPSTFDNNDSEDQAVTIHLKHLSEVKEESKEVTRTIHYLYENGKKAADVHTDKVIFNRSATKNLATGEVTYGEWTAQDEDTTFDAVTSPKIDGYTADQKEIEEVTGLTAEDENSDVTVTYTKEATEPSTSETETTTSSSETEESAESSTATSSTTTSSTTSGKATVNSGAKSNLTAGSRSTGGTTNQAAGTSKTTSSAKTYPSTGEKTGRYLTWIGSLAVIAVAVFGVWINRSKRKSE